MRELIQRTIQSAVILVLLLPVGSVSYTHLDVYKRQGWKSGGGGTAGSDGKGKAPPKRKAWTEPAPSCDGHQVRPAYCFAVNNISSLSTRAAKSWSCLLYTSWDSS